MVALLECVTAEPNGRELPEQFHQLIRMREGCLSVESLSLPQLLST